MHQYIVKATKDIGILMEGTMHFQESSKRKVKKAFRKQFKGWHILDIKMKDDHEHQSMESL